MNAIRLSGARAVQAEGARIGIVTCLECGAAILLDPTDKFDPVELHRQWHHKIEKLRRKK